MSDRDSKKEQSPRQQGGDGKQMILGFHAVIARLRQDPETLRTVYIDQQDAIAECKTSLNRQNLFYVDVYIKQTRND